MGVSVYDGAVLWSATYSAFGEASISQNSITNNLRFPGQYFDSETELHYNYFRYYDPEIGRYVTGDPIGLAGGINAYGYVGGNPLKFIDPEGLKYSFDCWFVKQSEETTHQSLVTRSVEKVLWQELLVTAPVTFKKITLIAGRVHWLTQYGREVKTTNIYSTFQYGYQKCREERTMQCGETETSYTKDWVKKLVDRKEVTFYHDEKTRLNYKNSSYAQEILTDLDLWNE